MDKSDRREKDDRFSTILISTCWIWRKAWPSIKRPWGFPRSGRRRPQTAPLSWYIWETGVSDFTLELTWLRDRKEPYNLGECEFHLAFHVDEYEELHARHEKMGCICFENPAMGIYFITDPDGYWIEIVPERK